MNETSIPLFDLENNIQILLEYLVKVKINFLEFNKHFVFHK